MLFYDIELKTIPKIKHSCIVATYEYNTSIAKNNQLLELCYVDKGDYVCQTADNLLVCEQGHLYPMLYGQKCEIYTESDRPVKMYSICLECGLSVNVIDSERLSEEETRALMKNLLSGNRFLLPKDGLSSNQFDWILPYVKKIVSCTPGERIGEETRALSLIIEFLSKITKKGP